MFPHLLTKKPASVSPESGTFYSAEFADDGTKSAGAYSVPVELLIIGTLVGQVAEFNVRFPSINIPQGSTITEAYIALVVYSGEFSHTVSVYFEDSDDAVAPTILSEFDNLVLTTAYGTWVTPNEIDEGGPIFNDPFDTGSLIAPIQEVVDRGGWSSGNALQAVFKDVDSEPLERTYVNAYFLGGSNKPALHISWT